MSARSAVRAAYVSQAREIMARARIEKPDFGWRLVLPRAGRQMIRRTRDALTAVVADLRALAPPPGDEEELEHHVLQPLDRQVALWDRLVTERRTVWWMIRHPEFDDEVDRREDVEFRRVYGLEDADAPEP